MVEHGGDQFGKKFLLTGQGIFFGVQDFLFLLLQIVGDIALAVHGCLTADVVFRHEVQIGFGNVDVVAEVVGVFYLQALDAGAGLFAAFEFRKPSFVVAGEGANSIQLRIKISTDRAAIIHIGRHFIRQSPVQ